jgi:hypothetical protein
MYRFATGSLVTCGTHTSQLKKTVTVLLQPSYIKLIFLLKILFKIYNDDALVLSFHNKTSIIININGSIDLEKRFIATQQ